MPASGCAAGCGECDKVTTLVAEGLPGGAARGSIVGAAPRPSECVKPLIRGRINRGTAVRRHSLTIPANEDTLPG